MRGHAETKKNEQKTEKNNEMHKNILRNCLCVLAGAAVLTIGIMAPKTIFAMMDKSEVDHIYVQQADTSYLDTAAQMTMEEKLDLMDGRSKGMHVSTSYPVEIQRQEVSHFSAFSSFFYQHWDMHCTLSQ